MVTAPLVSLWSVGSVRLVCIRTGYAWWKTPWRLAEKCGCLFPALKVQGDPSWSSSLFCPLLLTTVHKDSSACPTSQVQSTFWLSTKYFLQSHSLFTQIKFPDTLWQLPSKAYSISCLAFIILCNLNSLLKKSPSVTRATGQCTIRDQMNHAFHPRWQGSSIFPPISVLTFPISSSWIQGKIK